MKKFFKSIRRKSHGSKAPPPGGSPELGSSRGSTASLVIGYDVREKELGKLHKAAWTGDLLKVQQQAKKDPSPLDKEKRTPLHLACAQGHEDVVQELLEWKAKTNVGDADFRTPIMKAVECRHEGCVDLLLREKVELDSVDKDGNTCLHIAARDGLFKIVHKLCQAGASLSIKNKEGLAPLHVAIKEKQEEVCRIILSFKGQVDIEDNNKRTPLMHACQDGSVNLVKLLLDHGASTIQKDAKGWTADDCAQIKAHHACSQLIADHVMRQQRNSAASTPRSVSGSRSTTPRGASPFPFPAATDKDSVSFGLPVTDGGGDESGDETLSKVSAKGAGSDSWGDDTDISLAEDKRGKDGSGSDVDGNFLEEENKHKFELISNKQSATPKINLAKLVGYQHSESDDAEPQKTVKEKGARRPGAEEANGETTLAKVVFSKSVPSVASAEGRTHAAEDSPVTPRKSVSFKRDKELSEVHDITNTDSDEELDHEAIAFDHPSPEVHTGKMYFPSTPVGVPPPPYQLSAEKQRGHIKEEFMEELGLGDMDDVSETSEMSEHKAAAVHATLVPPVASSATGLSDSDWDATVKSEMTARPGILKKGSKASIYDDADTHKQFSNNQEPSDQSDWDSTAAEDIPPPLPTSPQPKLNKVPEWESDIEEMVVPTVAKKIPKEDSDWDSTFEAVTPRVNAGLAYREVQEEESDWDTTVETVTPRGRVDTFVQERPADEAVFSEDEETESAVMAVVHGNLPLSMIGKFQVADSSRPIVTTSTVPIVAKHTAVRETPAAADSNEEDESSWDSEEDAQPSDAASHLTLDVLPSPLPPQQEQQHHVVPQEEVSDTDDELDETEPISEWEMEHMHLKGQKLSAGVLHGHSLADKNEDDDFIHMTGFGVTVAQSESEQPGQKKYSKHQVEGIEEKASQRKWEEQVITPVNFAKKQWEGEEIATPVNVVQREQEGKDNIRQQSAAQQELEIKGGHLAADAELQQELDKARNLEERWLLQWERDEVDRQERWQTEVQEAFLGEDMLHDLPTGEDDSSVNEELELALQPQTLKTTCVSTLDVCGNNSRSASNTMLSVDCSDVFPPREEWENSKQQVEAVPHADRISNSKPPQNSSSSLSIKMGSAGTAGKSLQFSPGRPNTSAGSQGVGSVTQQIKQHLQVGNTHTTYHNDDSVASDSERVDISSYYPSLLGHIPSSRPDFNMVDDDVLSYTSTEFESDHLPASSGPFSRDILLNMDLSDPASIIHVQNHMREMRRQLEEEKNQRSILESKVRLLGQEKQDLYKKLENLSESKQRLEQSKLELEANLRSLEYSLSEEKEKKNSAELLLVKTREQLSRKEQQFTSEVEAKQQAELLMRNIQLEMRAAQTTIKELEEEREELERQLEHEHNARKLQEQISEDQIRLAHHHTQETLASMTASRVENSMGEDAVDSRVQEERDKLNAEIYALKMEMDRQRSRLKDEIGLAYTENEELQTKIEELRNEQKLNEEAMAHATVQYNVQLAGLKTEVASVTSALDKERAGREKLEAELDSLEKRLQGSAQEKDKAVHARNELEREIQRDRQTWVLDKERKEDEINNLKDSIQHQSQKFLSMEGKLTAVENELHVSNTLLMERTSQLQHLKQELERYKAGQDSFDSNIRLEKDLTAKLQIKIESLQERLTQSQHEVLSLKQEIEMQHAAGIAASASDSNEQLNAIISSLRSDSDRARAMLEERNSNLLEQVSQLKEEARNVENRRSTLEAECRRLQGDLTEITRKLSFTEAQLQMVTKAQDELQYECGRLKVEIEKSNQKSSVAQEKLLEAQTRVAEMTERLDRAERASQLSTQHLANASASFTTFTRSKEELEENMQRLQVANARLEAELHHERERGEMLQAEISDSHKVRNSLEALCSNLKSTTAHLEEKLGEEAATRVIFASEAKDSKGLLDQELAARSRLGLRVVRLEKANKVAQMKMEEARRVTSDMENKKAAFEAQLAEKTQKNEQLQKEVSNLRAHLKAAKKKLKEGGVTAPPLGGSEYLEFRQEIPTENGKVSTPRGGAVDNNIDSHHHFHHICKKEGPLGDVESVQQELEAKYRQELNRKLEEVNIYLENQARASDRLNSSRSEHEAKLLTDKRQLEEENANLRLQYEQAVAQRESRETEARRYKQLYESELRWRSRLSDQLFTSSEKSLQHGLRLGSTERLRPRLHNSIGNLSMSAWTEGYADASRIGGDRNEALSNKIRAELDRSIAKHLEAAPHNNIVPVVHDSEKLLSSSLAQSSRDYIEVLKRKYCV